MTSIWAAHTHMLGVSWRLAVEREREYVWRWLAAGGGVCERDVSLAGSWPRRPWYTCVSGHVMIIVAFECTCVGMRSVQGLGFRV